MKSKKMTSDFVFFCFWEPSGNGDVVFQCGGFAVLNAEEILASGPRAGRIG